MARRSRLAVVHESPHRVREMLATVGETLPHTMVSARCDRTKKYEKTLRGPVAQVLDAVEPDSYTHLDVYKRQWEESGAFVAHREEGKKPFTIVRCV